MVKTTPAMTEEEIEIEHEIRHEVIEYEIQHEEQVIQINSAESMESLPNPGIFHILTIHNNGILFNTVGIYILIEHLYII